jgi:ribosome biogenesis protein ENP2
MEKNWLSRKEVILKIDLGDRNIELHAQYGRHYKIRTPKVGRDMAYIPATCDLVTVGAGNEIYRLNLEQGRFLGSLESDSPEINCVAYNTALNWIATGGIDGVVEMWSMDDRQKLIELPIKNHKAFENYDMSEITSLAFSKDGMHLAIGNESGKLKLFDIRYPIPIFEKTHQYRLPIKKVAFHESSRTVFSMDKKVIKIYERDTGKLYTNVQAKKDINDFAMYQNSGMIFTAWEEEKLGAYFIPSLGQAPKWCHYIENLTEEMEEKQKTTSYEDYKFLTKNDLEKINASHLIGSKMLKPYMHGFFMDYKYYLKLKEVNDPFAFEKYRKNKISQKLEELRENRIVFQRTLPKVNSKFMEEVLNRDIKKSKKALKSREKAEITKNLLQDERFSKMFNDKEFLIDKNSVAFKQIKPTQSKYAQDRSDEDEEEPKEVSHALDSILGNTAKSSDKKKELTERVPKINERIAPIPEFKKKDKNARERKVERKEKMMKGKKMPTLKEMRERKKGRRIAVPLSKLLQNK